MRAHIPSSTIHRDYDRERKEAREAGEAIHSYGKINQPEWRFPILQVAKQDRRYNRQNVQRHEAPVRFACGHRGILGSLRGELCYACLVSAEREANAVGQTVMRRQTYKAVRLGLREAGHVQQAREAVA
jgi:hypothetical protein